MASVAQRTAANRVRQTALLQSVCCIAAYKTPIVQYGVCCTDPQPPSSNHQACSSCDHQASHTACCQSYAIHSTIC
jgi:hypothetical protein